MPSWSPIVGWTPSFLLKRYVLSGIRDGPHEPFIADSVDLVVAQVQTLSKDDLASRLSISVDAASVGHLMLSDSLITTIDVKLKDQVTERYPGARQASLKSGGDFPFLSRPDEVNLHLQLHLRRVGVEARQDMVPGIRKDDSGGSSSSQNDKRGNTDDETPQDDKKDFGGGPTNSNEPPLLPEGSDSDHFENQTLSQSYLSSDDISGENMVHLIMLPAVLENGIAMLACEAVLNAMCEYTPFLICSVFT
ncbi:hypothetical protein ACP275_09G094600 [Erythranthe tilingii]